MKKIETENFLTYEVATRERKLYDEHYMNEEEDFYEKLLEEQIKVLQENGIDFYNSECLIHWFKGAYSHDCLQVVYLEDVNLVSKDGVDLVRFSNGNLGMVAYYNDNKDMFEILGWRDK